MILVDYSQTVISSVFAGQYVDIDETDDGNNEKAAITEDLLRHVVLNTIRSYVHAYSEEYGNLVICCDGKKSWRKEHFPQYKANRRKERNTSSIDWKSLFDLMEKIRDELAAHSPFPVIHIDSLEGDDCIGVLTDNCVNGSKPEKTLIISSDKDFLQLQKSSLVNQYSPSKKEMMHVNDPQRFLLEHIIKGDASDGIPNIFSDDNIFLIEGKRQTPATKKRVGAWLEYLTDGVIDPSVVTEEAIRNFNRNKVLIDLDCCPRHHREAVIREYENQCAKDVSEQDFMEYLISHKMKELLESIDEFFSHVQ